MEYEWDHRLKSDSGFSSSSNETASSANVRIEGLNFFLQEKIIYLEQVIKNIEAMKEAFLEKCEEGNRLINYDSMKIYIAGERRKTELEGRLRQIAKSRILSWNKQLKICEEAETWLKNIKTDSSPCGEMLRERCNKYMRDVGFINSAKVHFSGDEAAMNYFLSVGRSNPKKIMPKICFGIKRQGSLDFKSPWEVCTDRTGRILIAESGRNRIQIFNELGNFLLQFGKRGHRAGEFNRPMGITVDKKCRIIITDKDNHRVQVFTYSGGFMFMFGRKGSKAGQFHYPWGVDTNLEGDIAVCDTENHRVQLFTTNGMFISEFLFTNQIRRLDYRLDRRVCPVRVAFKPDGTLLVTDLSNGIILKIDVEFSRAVKIQDYMTLSKPQGIACNSNGMFIVADSEHCKIQIFNSQEEPYMVFGVPGKNLGEFDSPQGICFHPNGSIVVGDFRNNRIQVFDFPLCD